MASQAALVVKNPPANAGDVRDAGLIPGSGRSAGGGHGSHSGFSPQGRKESGRWSHLARVHAWEWSCGAVCWLSL